jgi:hypothetical protein
VARTAGAPARQEGPHQAHQLVAAAHLAQPALAGAEGHQVAAQAQVRQHILGSQQLAGAQV